MSNTKAYPSKEIDLSESQIHGRQIVYDQHSGMDLRDYFAAKAMQGIFENNEKWMAMCMDRINSTRDKSNDTQEDYVAQQCYGMADAMINEREKK